MKGRIRIRFFDIMQYPAPRLNSCKRLAVQGVIG